MTSEPQSLAAEAESSWQFGFPAVGDPHHEIRDACRDRGWLDLFVNERQSFQQTMSWTSHLNGYFQPGLLAVTREGRVLYRWRCRPTHGNLGGAVERPTPEYTWAQIQSRSDDSAGDAALDASPELDSKAPRWPIFVALLLAHGWFLKPRVFPVSRDASKPTTTPKDVMPRLAVFACLWVAAFVFLPTGWVALAALAWAAWLTPSVITLNRQFQNVPEGEPG